jgi:hypothetical protein
MGESYLVQEVMGICHDIIGDMDKYAPWVWKEEEDEQKIRFGLLLFDITLLVSSSSFYLNLSHHFLCSGWL